MNESATPRREEPRQGAATRSAEGIADTATPAPTTDPDTPADGDTATAPAESATDDGEHRSDVEERSGRRASGKQRLPLWLDTVLTMVVALVIAVLVKTFLIQPFYIPSASMNPTLLQDDKIIVSKLTPGVFDLNRGDVIVFEDPDEWIPGDATENPTPRVRLMMVLSLVGLAPDPSQDHLVKRLIGLPGDHVACESQGAALEVNGTELSEPYINPETPACQEAFDVTVPSGHVWVMGDNRYASADSAWHHTHGGDGFVPESSITGRAEAVFWPASRWTGLGEGRAAFDAVPDPS